MWRNALLSCLFAVAGLVLPGAGAAQAHGGGGVSWSVGVVLYAGVAMLVVFMAMKLLELKSLYPHVAHIAYDDERGMRHYHQPELISFAGLQALGGGADEHGKAAGTGPHGRQQAGQPAGQGLERATQAAAVRALAGIDAGHVLAKGIALARQLSMRGVQVLIGRILPQ